MLIKFTNGLSILEVVAAFYCTVIPHLTTLYDLKNICGDNLTSYEVGLYSHDEIVLFCSKNIKPIYLILLVQREIVFALSNG